jgi:hypothetical protein
MTENYEQDLSDFILDITGELGGSLPQDYFTIEELTNIEKCFKQMCIFSKKYPNGSSQYDSEREKILKLVNSKK